jgi:vitamin B12 transporter
VRLRIVNALSAKASYEYATRLPAIEEIYGDGLLISPNLELLPELSHNANVGLQLSPLRTPIGRFASEINGFLRFADRLIALLPDAGASSQFKNLFSARTAGVEGSLSYTSPGSWVALDGSATWQDPRQSNGERIPNRPWLFATFSGRFQLRDALTRGDELSPFYVGRYVHDFLRSSGELTGDPRFKATIPAQLSQSIGVSYSTSARFLRCTTTFEVDNVANAKLYDFFGVQRPGRTFAIRVTGEI